MEVSIDVIQERTNKMGNLSRNPPIRPISVARCNSIAVWDGRWTGIAANVGDASEYLPRSGNFSSIPIFTYHMPFYSLLIALATLFLPPVQSAILVNVVSYLGFGSVVYLLSETYGG